MEGALRFGKPQHNDHSEIPTTRSIYSFIILATTGGGSLGSGDKNAIFTREPVTVDSLLKARHDKLLGDLSNPFAVASPRVAKKEGEGGKSRRPSNEPVVVVEGPDVGMTLDATKAS